jgi:hypothetical protein
VRVSTPRLNLELKHTTEYSRGVRIKIEMSIDSVFVGRRTLMFPIPQPLPLLEPLVEPVPILEMGRVASGRASGIKFLPQHFSFEYRWII